MRLRLALAFAAALAAAPIARAQDAPNTRVVLTDGRVLVGTVVDNGDGTLTITDRSGVRTVVPADRVRSQTTVAAGAYAQTDPANSRLFIAPTARVIPDGQKRLSTFTIMPSFGVGIGGRADVSIYATIPTGDGGFAGLNGKVALVQTPSTAVAAGASIGTAYGVGGIDETPFGGTFYLLGTFGSESRSVTAGAFGFYGGALGESLEVGNGMGVLLGGDYQIANRVKLMSENMIAILFESGGGVGTYHLAGARFFSGGVTGDLAVAIVQGDGEVQVSPIPYFGFSYNF
ncbi:MAG: hypothetical protein IAE99_04135 [Rhodothermales bacterium]|nr:hypothetical protein [Rhodothermales bacterium]